MNFDDYVKTKPNIIGNPEVFQISYTPDEIVSRKPTYIVYNETSKFVKYRIPLNMLILGPPGSGKTVTIKFVCSRINKLNLGVSTIYISCRDRTANQILNTLAGNGQKAHSDDTLVKMFMNRLTKDTLIVLDEVDMGRKIRDMIYLLSRFREINQTQAKNLSLILITNDLGWEDTLDSAVRSSLQLKKIFFFPYNENELKRILIRRVRLGLKKPNVISDQNITTIARMTIKEKQGDCRVALRALFRAAMKAEEKRLEKIDEECIRKSFADTIKSIEEERVMGLTNNQLFLLAACVGADTIENIYKKYTDITKELNVKRMKKTMMYYALFYLDLQGLIKRRTVSRAGEKVPKKGTEIEMIVNRELLKDEVGRRINALRGVTIENK